MYKVTNYINGKENLDSYETLDIVNPSYGTQIGEVLYATERSANDAIDVAAEAFKS